MSTTCTLRNAGCIQDNNTLTCNLVPGKIPETVTHVYLKGINIEQDELEFKSESWRSVLLLDIETVEGEFFRKRGMPLFSDITNLTHLGIHAGYLSSLDQEIFIGLPFLKILDLSNCLDLDMEEVNKLFINNKSLPNLQQLFLNYLNVDDIIPITIGTTFIANLSKRPIKVLSLRGAKTMFNFDSKSFDKLCNSVEELDISNIIYSHIPQSSSKNFYSCESLRVVNATGLYFGAALLAYLKVSTGIMSTIDLDFDLSGFPSLETIYFNNLDYGKTDVKLKALGDYIVCAPNKCNLANLRNLYLAGNRMAWLNVTLITYRSSLHLIDLSKNGLEYIAPGFFQYFVSLKDVSLYDNKLYVMEYFDDFENLFRTLNNLLKINLAKNDLTVIPESMFDKNLDLENIDLSYNKLSFVNPSFTNLKKLRSLNLRNNRILLSNADFTLVFEYLQARFLALDNKFYFDISGNSFMCTCKESRVLRWLYVYLNVRLQNKDKLQCILNGKNETITERIVLETQQMCHRHKAIIVSVTLTACVLGV